MYEAHFNLQKRPFCATPDPNCFFASNSIQEILDQLVFRVEGGEGIGVLTGEAGMGKTLLCRRVAAELNGRVTPVFLPNANVTTKRALFQSILFELDRKFSGLDEQEMRLATIGLMRELRIAGRGVALIVDEAHLVSDRLLEELRLFACLADDGTPLVRLILAGQPVLEERLLTTQLQALNQRISCQLCLESLTGRESIEYVACRISWAGGNVHDLFDAGAIERIASAASGSPRCLNQLCDHALLLAFVREQSVVSADIVAEALQDLRQLPLQWNISPAADSANGSEDVSVVNEHVMSPWETRSKPREYEGKLSNWSEEPASAPTASFEIGEIESPLADESENQETEPVEISVEETSAPVAAESERRKRAPRPEVVSETTTVRRCDFPVAGEELLVDRYAVLDANVTAVERTFECVRVSAIWLAPKASPVPSAPEPPAVVETLESDGLHPLLESDIESPFDEVCELLAQPVVVSSDAVDNKIDVSAESTDPVHRELEIEELLHYSLLETCREVRSAIGQWHEEEISPTATNGSTVNEGSVTPLTANAETAEFAGDDIVFEPVAAMASGDDRPTEFRGNDKSPASLRIEAPQPKYRMLFSTLRRRLGRAH
jgi:type II secretory pathway predicted ATPase ExeA